jgi:hypothetical protein
VPERDRAWAGRARNEFYGNDFSAANLIDVTFRTGIDLTRQRLPAGENYIYLAEAGRALERARKELCAWQDIDLRAAALTMVKTLQEEVDAGQQQMFLRPDDYYAYSAPSREVIDGVFALLRSAEVQYNTQSKS